MMGFFDKLSLLPLGEKAAPQGRMRGELAAVARKQVAAEGSALISHLR